MFNKLTKLQKMAKISSFGPDFGPFGPNSGSHYFFHFILFFFFKNLALSVTRYQVSYHHVYTISEKKTNYPILRKLGDRQLDRQRNQSDFIGCCPTNIKHPTFFVMF